VCGVVRCIYTGQSVLNKKYKDGTSYQPVSLVQCSVYVQRR
jgi:hypothetical protein